MIIYFEMFDDPAGGTLDDPAADTLDDPAADWVLHHNYTHVQESNIKTTAVTF